jgi:predicted metalloendopeptidase
LYHNQKNTKAKTIFENNVSSWKEYMKWTLLNGSTGLLSTTVDAANFDFLRKDINRSNQTKDHLKKELCKRLTEPSVKL